MKKLLLTGIILFFAVGVMAQSKNDLKGPRAKNYKPWMDDSRPTMVLSSARVDKPQGPEAKNQKPWENAGEYKAVRITSGKKRDLKGPAAKNRKPWED